MKRSSIAYLDHNATTPVRPEVLDAMLPFLRESYGNPSSVHSLGQSSRKAVERAREQVAALIGAAHPDEIVFTSGGSEADALAVAGGARARRSRSGGARTRIVTSAIEHEAVLGAAGRLEREGFAWLRLGVDRSARVDPAEAARAAAAPETALVSVMLANNEVGTIQPVAEIARACRERGVLMHTDAVQAAGKIPVDVSVLSVDLLSLSGHKINAPKGVGALYIRDGVVLEAMIDGKQERNRRGGTENAASIVGFGAAADLARRELDAESARIAALRDRLEAGVLELPGARRTVSGAATLPGTAHFCFEGVESHTLVVALDLNGVAVSGGAACAAGEASVSHVLKAAGVPAELGAGALRVSLGSASTPADVDRFLEVLPACLEKQMVK